MNIHKLLVAINTLFSDVLLSFNRHSYMAV